MDNQNWLLYSGASEPGWGRLGKKEKFTQQQAIWFLLWESKALKSKLHRPNQTHKTERYQKDNQEIDSEKWIENHNSCAIFSLMWVKLEYLFCKHQKNEWLIEIFSHKSYLLILLRLKSNKTLMLKIIFSSVLLLKSL
jgi:hypothetical protein